MGIVLVNSKDTIQSVNSFTLKLFGHTTEEEIVEKPIEILIPQRHHHKYIYHRDKYIHHPKSRPMGLGMDLFAIKKDGTEFPVEVSLGNYRNNSEENIIAFISDISVRKKAEVEIKKLNEELEVTVEQHTMELTNTMRQLENSKEELSKSLEKKNWQIKARFCNNGSP